MRERDGAIVLIWTLSAELVLKFAVFKESDLADCCDDADQVAHDKSETSTSRFADICTAESQSQGEPRNCQRLCGKTTERGNLSKILWDSLREATNQRT
jgi:hypothetical protein